MFDDDDLIYQGEDDPVFRNTWKDPEGQEEMVFRIFMPASSNVTHKLRVLARSGDRVQDISTATQLPGSFELSRNASGHAVALLRRPVDAFDVEPRRIEIRRRGNDVAGVLDGRWPDWPAIAGWAADLRSPGRNLEIVAFLGSQEFWVGRPDLERRDVAERYGGDQLLSGFLLPPPASSSTNESPELAAEQRQRIRREGLVVYAVPRRGPAARLRFSYRPIERGRRNVEVLPVSDGRELFVQEPGSGLDGAVDLVAKRGRRTLIEGWAADIERGEAARQIVVYRDNEHLVTLGLSRDRQDVASHFNNRRLLRTGFQGAVPEAPSPTNFANDHRVFAIMVRGVAVELPILKRSPDSSP